MTTPDVPGREIRDARGIVNARVVAGTSFLVDLLTNWSDTFGGRSVLYQQELDRMQKQLLGELADAARQRGADAVVGIRVDYDSIAAGGKTMFMATALGTAVTLAPLERPRPAYSDLSSDTAAVDVRRVLSVVGQLLTWADAFASDGTAGGPQRERGSAPLADLGAIPSPAAWAAAVEREGPELIDRFEAHLRGLSGPHAGLLLAHLLTRTPDPSRVDEAAALLEDPRNLPQLEGIARQVSLHWPLVAPRLTEWLRRGGAYRALAMNVVANGQNTSIRLADLETVRMLRATVRDLRWAGDRVVPPAPWSCGCGNTRNPGAEERCTHCGLLTRGLTPRDVPYPPSQLAGYLAQQERLLSFLRPSAGAS